MNVVGLEQERTTTTLVAAGWRRGDEARGGHEYSEGPQFRLWDEVG